MTTLTDSQAVAAATAALRTSFPGDPSTGEICALDAVAILESNRGEGWKGAGVGSNNQGAIQCGHQWVGPRFSYVDTHPNPDGTSTRYSIDFRKYPTRLAGLLDLTQVMYVQHGRSVVRQCAHDQDWMGVSREMHNSGYYEGQGATVEDRIANHNRALMRGINRDLAVLGQAPAPVPVVVTIPDTINRGDGAWNGNAATVAELQRELRLAADGEFGPVTDVALRAYQRAKGLMVDGVCGPKTWAALLADDYTPGGA
jgi:peptidoglycan hydrolase-like protein with peptidoglycan-binding domain